MALPIDQGRVALTPDRVIDVAAALTHRSHLLGWSIRDLARELDVVPSVVYHHVGGKDRIARGVVERALDGIVSPGSDLPWSYWFRELLDELYPRLTAYPGAAKWLLMHGPTFPSVMPIVGAGIGVLERAGFGSLASMAYATLLNTPILTITVGDDRLVHEDDGPRDHAQMMEEFRASAVDHPGAGVLADSFIQQFADGAERRDRVRAENYGFVVQTVIAGLERRLLDIRGNDEKSPGSTRVLDGGQLDPGL